ncbi:MAG: hypothetical protein EAX86_09860 [Candidatus Heimdallarchaeota archaeon]|nr:hypothetical protein [Candidatus Heimdallarchaeota archaeon]
MQILLVKLARFITPKEQEKVREIFNKNLIKYSIENKVLTDNWRAKNRFLIKLEKPQTSKLLERVLSHPAVISVISFENGLFDWESSSFSALIKEIVRYLRMNNSTERCALDFRRIGKIPIHRKAVIDRLQRNKIQVLEDNDFILYIEIRQGENSKIYVRLGRKHPKMIQDEKLGKVPILVLFSPFTLQEIADFFRLGLVFNTTILFSDENHRVKNLVDQVEKTYFKGISKVNYRIIPSIEDHIEKELENCFGFSLWGNKTTEELEKDYFLRKKALKTNQNLYFIFGNEETGLPLSIREKIPIFRIGNKSSEPLRASQAAAFALGTIFKN